MGTGCLREVKKTRRQGVWGNDEGYSAGGLGYGDENLGDRRRGVEIGRGIWSRGRRFGDPEITLDFWESLLGPRAHKGSEDM